MSAAPVLSMLIVIAILCILAHSLLQAFKAPYRSAEQLLMSWAVGSIATFCLIFEGSYGEILDKARSMGAGEFGTIQEIIALNTREVSTQLIGSFVLWAIIFVVFSALGYLANTMKEKPAG